MTILEKAERLAARCYQHGRWCPRCRDLLEKGTLARVDGQVACLAARRLLRAAWQAREAANVEVILRG